MRLKHVKGAEKVVEENRYIISDYQNYKGKFQNIFSNSNEFLFIEIGTGKGDFIIENAKRYPHINFIGIEKYDSVLVRALQKVDELQLSNLKLIRMDATNIDEIFEDEVDLIYLNFSDPWPKKRHAKRRLSSDAFLEKYEKIFKNDKKIIMKTDNRKLFEYSIQSFTDFGYKIQNISLDLYQDNIEDNIPTEYEMKFHSLGYPIYKIEVLKK